MIVDALADVLWWSGVSRPSRRAAGVLTIVTFHRVLPPAELAAYPYPGIAVTPDELDWAVGLLDRHFAIAPVTTSWLDHVDGAPSDKPRLSITFDDGQWDNAAFAAPVLDAHSVRATFYIPVEPVRDRALIWHDELGYAIQHLCARGEESAAADIAARHGLTAEGHDLVNTVVEAAKGLDPPARSALVGELVLASTAVGGSIPDWGRLMSWDEIRTLHRQGHEIGSHSMSHTLLPQLDDAAIHYEVADSKAAIEAALQAPVTSFCYPNGDNDSRARQAAAAAGYDNGVSTRWGRNRVDANPYVLARCDWDARRSRDRQDRPSVPRVAMRLGDLQPGLS